MASNPNQIKLGKKKDVSKKLSDWLFPAKTDSQPRSIPETKEMSKQKMAKQVADDLLKRRAAGETSKLKPYSRLLDAVEAFLIGIGYSSSSQALKAERDDRGENGLNTNETLSLIDIFNEWQKLQTSKKHQDTGNKDFFDRKADSESRKTGNIHVQDPDRNSCSNSSSSRTCQGSDVHMSDENSSPSSSDSSSSSSSSSDSDADDEKDVSPIKSVDTSKSQIKGKKRKASFSSSSDSSSDQPTLNLKKTRKIAKISETPTELGSKSNKKSKTKKSSSSKSASSSPPSASSSPSVSSESSVSDSSSENSSSNDSSSSDSSSTDSSSSDSSNTDSSSSDSSNNDSSSSDPESTSDEDLITVNEENNDSSSSDSSSSNNDSNSSSQLDTKISTRQVTKSDSKSSGSRKSKVVEKKMTAQATNKNILYVAQHDTPKESSSETSLRVIADGKSVETPKSKKPIARPASFGKKSNEPFSRIPKDIKVDEKLASNAYVPYDYAQKAHEDLIVTKGKSFTKEKNKKKRGSYRGGQINVEDKKGIKFED